MSALLGTIINNTFAYDLAIKAFLNNYYNISNKIHYIIQNNIERLELKIKSYAKKKDYLIHKRIAHYANILSMGRLRLVATI